VVPDIITFAKGVNSGYVPLGGVIMNEAIYGSFAQKAYPGGLTYSGHPLACAAAVATMKAMDDEGMIEHAQRIGEEVIGPRLRQIAENSKHVGEVRGVGAFWAIELVWDKESREPLAPYGGGSPEVASVVSSLKELGVVPFSNYHRLHVVPPINISDEDLETGLGVFEKVLTDLDFSR
ncbi:aminotransferase class III-fold pyridoxal phosphate-dependent enzyme, partial [Brevibacterium sp.]